MVRLIKVSDETHRDLQIIQKTIVHYGIKNLPCEFQPVIAEISEEKIATYKAIVAVAVKFLRISIEKLTKGEG